MHESTSRILREIYDDLFHAYGPQQWWPAETATEVVVGAVLTQNTAWSNVERAIDNLKRADCLTWSALRDLPEGKLAELLHPSGTYRVKTTRLKAFVGALWTHHGGSLDSMLQGDVETARRRLLTISGIGPETADAILLYAAHRPTFVIDAYTRRVLRRHLVIGADADYETIRRLFQQSLPPDVPLYNEYHALLVAVGKRHCRPHARCSGCPLQQHAHEAEL